uniref:Centrosomal protein 83 n=1 Tax=Oncorhynchus kisutch TaxID=8019 RepID=A0A8C7K1E4_ONCKI
MLIDERMRCENHRINYQTLKAEHTRFVSLCMAVFLSSVPVCTAVGLFCKVLTPQRLELLRAQVQQEMEGTVRERFNKLEGETEEYRSEYNKLRYDYTFLKSEFDHQREESARIREEKKIRFDAEVSRLERDRAELMAQYQGTDLSRDCKRIESLLREKAQLYLRLKGLEADVAELRAQRDNSGQQAENVQHIQVRQFAESQAAAKSLEAERLSLRLQSECLGRELQLSHEQNIQLTGRLHKAEREVNTLTSQVRRGTHKLEVANVKPECARSRGEVESESDALQGMQSDVEVLKGTVERHKEVLAEREGELARRVQAARDEEFHKTATVHEEKLGSLSLTHSVSDYFDEVLTTCPSLPLTAEPGAGVTASHSEAELLESNQCLRETLERAREDLMSPAHKLRGPNTKPSGTLLHLYTVVCILYRYAVYEEEWNCYKFYCWNHQVVSILTLSLCRLVEERRVEGFEEKQTAGEGCRAAGEVRPGQGETTENYSFFLEEQQHQRGLSEAGGGSLYSDPPPPPESERGLHCRVLLPRSDVLN